MSSVMYWQFKIAQTYLSRRDVERGDVYCFYDKLKGTRQHRGRVVKMLLQWLNFKAMEASYCQI